MNQHIDGFSFLELVLVLVILGILAATVLPRLQDTGPVEMRATQDRLVAAVRYAQQTAMRKGPDANVSFIMKDNVYRIEIDGTPMRLPTGSYSESLPGGVSVGDITVGYTSLGNTTAGGLVTLTLSASGGTRQICIEVSGYAHQC